MSKSPEHDVSMSDENEDSSGENDQENQELAFAGTKKLVVLEPASNQAASFQIEREDHTLGNALRYFINKNPEVEFCGYTIPHPSETKMHLRIQIWEDCDTTVYEALKKGLEDMMEACDVVAEKFTASRDKFEAGKSQV